MNRYSTETEILELVSSFESCTISRDEWKHAEHLIVALYYVSNNDLETATNKMRTGIFKLLAAFGVDLTKEMPYHETLTVFWMRTVYTYSLMHIDKPLAYIAVEVTTKFDKDLPLRFYSRERLFSDAAHEGFIDSDLMDIRLTAV